MGRNLLYIALAGSAGTLARFFLSNAVQRICGADFSWGTWAVNVLGCFLFGLVWVLSEERFLFSSETRLIILVGFMGAFTTFSTYIFESAAFGTSGDMLRMAANLLGQNIAGFAALFLGMASGRIV
ncbi:fluoride efflux transporter FluC [Fundidesulfovibrio agrisoli]|uniref:fluoride efflux transporter FluC n=1 Tax=Fundidesulfovibrio agrisoli TaxID=2922717 RepID=UPI001FAC599B|nr:CrcB family protein [Fundidesulfovibrio agrisoli]